MTVELCVEQQAAVTTSTEAANNALQLEPSHAQPRKSLQSPTPTASLGTQPRVAWLEQSGVDALHAFSELHVPG